MIRENICKAITESGLKQKAIAEKMGISEQTLSAMLKGKRKITADEFIVMCVIIKKSPNEISGMDSLREHIIT